MKTWQHSLRWVLGCLMLGLGLPTVTSGAVYTVYWRDQASSGWWVDGNNNHWYRADDGWDVRREDLATGHWHPDGYKNPNKLIFNNAHQTTMTINNLGGAEHRINQILFQNGSSRTFAQDGGAYLKLEGDGTPKIEADAGGTGTYTFSVPLLLAQKVELNPVNGNLTFNGAITNGGNWIDVWGNNGKALNLNGAISGAGGIAVKENSVVTLAGNNVSFSGNVWVEQGTLRLTTSLNAPPSGSVSVGTNATLDVALAATFRASTLYLYNGQVTKTVTSGSTWSGALNSYNSSTVTVSLGNFLVNGGLNIPSGTLVFNNAYEGGMSGGSMTGAGTLIKQGGGVFRLRPGTHSGNIMLSGGKIKQYTGTMSAGGTLTMAGGTEYGTDGTTLRTMTKALSIQGNVGLSEIGSGGMLFSGAVNLNGGVRVLTSTYDSTISGKISNGGLTKAGGGKMTLTGDNDYTGGTTISAGTLQIGDNGTTGSVAGNIVNNSALVWYRSDSPTYTGIISGTGTMTKQGAGTLTLSDNSTYSGATTVSAGTLLVSGSIGSSAVTVASGATLAGAGTVGALTMQSGSTVSPGNANGTAGTLNVNGAASLVGTYTCDITGTGSTACDKIAATGAVSASGGLTINLGTTAPTGFNQATSYSWTIMSGSSVNIANMALGTTWTASGTFALTTSGNTVVVTYTAPKPATPTGLTASDGSSTAQVAVSWNAVTGATSYELFRNTANNFAGASSIYSGATASYNDTGATPGQQYWYWVRASNASGSSDASSPDTGYRKLTAPTGVAATDGSSTAQVTVSWSAVTGATAYHVYRKTDSSPTGATALGVKTSGFADTTAEPGQKYWYWVVASNNTSSSVSDWSTADTGYRKLATVQNVAATENRTDMVRVTWSDIAGETGYGIWRHTANNSGAAACIGSAAADATSYDDTGATAGVTYYYWVRATNSTSASMSDFSASDSGMKMISEPTTPASNITFSDLASASYTVNWTRGNGDSVLVVARQGSAPAAPVDNTTYTANAAFSSGDTTATGSFVVYKGSGTSVNVTGLSAGTEYYFAVYEFNGSTTPNYLQAGAPVASRTTLATEPSIQASGMAISSPAEVSMSGFTWTAGNGVGRILVAKAGAPVDSFPVDGVTYTGSTNFGTASAEIGTGNYVLWVGTGTPNRISSLARDTVYHFRLFEYNGSGDAINYNTSAATGNPISQTTMAANPGSAVSDLALSNIGTDRFTVTWTKGTAGTNTLIVVRAGSAPTGPADRNTYDESAAFGSGSDLGSGSYVVYTNTGTSVTVTGLTPGTLYYVRAYAFNGADGAQNYRTSDPANANGYTLTLEPTQATAITFGTLADTSYAISFTAGNGLSRLVVVRQGGAVSWTPTDGVAVSGENNNFASAADLGSGNKLVHRGAGPFTLSGLTAATEYHVRVFEYNGTNATLNYNVSAASGNPASRYTLSTEPSAYGALTATALSDTQVKLDWTAATGANGYIIVRKTGSAPSGAPVDGVGYAQGNNIGDGQVVAVIASGAAGSHTDSYNTAANTTYHYLIFPFAYDGTPAHGTYNYRTSATVPGANATTGKAEPTTSSTITSFLPTSSSSATVVWDNTGSADGTIILIRAGGAVSANPSDWTSYTANLAYGSGSQIGTGNYVVVAGAGKSGSATITGLSAGTSYHIAVYPYNGSGSMLNYRTTSPATASVTILPDPTAATATVDGKTMVRLAWTKNASYGVMIVYKQGSASTAPTQGTAYNVGGACGGGTVIYKGTGASLEHVVASDKAHHYAFYSYSGNNYSAGVTASDSTSAFSVGEIVETFSYTNSTALTGLNGERGWGGAWYGDTGAFSNNLYSLGAQANYPTPTGNKIWTHPPNNESRFIYRPLDKGYQSGRIYFSYMMQYQWEGNEKYAGLSLMWSNSSEKLFIGKLNDQVKKLGIENTSSGYDLAEGETYIIAGYYDWATGEAKAAAFHVGTQTVPKDEPTTWDVNAYKDTNYVGVVNGIRLAAGSSAGRLGDVYFDEVRIATNWAGIVQIAPSKPADPANATATVDGHEMVRLAWTKNGAGSDVMVLHKTSAITTGPTDGTGYAVGNTIDGATVIYRGAATALEHVVTPGSANVYKFYSVNSANYYSTGIVASATMGTYLANEWVNPFSYTNDTAFSASMKGGQGFGANYWAANSGTWKARTNNAVATTDVPRFFDMTGYPPMAGNLAWVEDPGNGNSATADRSLASPISAGTFYVAFMMAYQYHGPDKWAGLSLTDNNGAEVAFFGKGGGANYHTLAAAGGGSTFWANFDFLPYSGSTVNVYMVVGKYDFSTKQLQTKAWNLAGNTFPDTEPTSWDASGTLSGGISQIARIRLNVGSHDSAGTIGRVFFDEIRYATNWAGLVAVKCPTWAGSNTFNNAAWTAPTTSWLGDSESYVFQSYPPGPGQIGSIEFDWAQDNTFATVKNLPWLKNENENTYWSNRVQSTSAGVFTSRFVAAGSGCDPVRTNNPALTVQNLNPPTGASAVRDGTHTNSQINLAWTLGISDVPKDVIVVRQTVDTGWTAPVNGVTYQAGDALGSGTVVYRGSATTFADGGLAPNTTYYYRFYSENWSYYSVAYAAANAKTATGGQSITIDGNPADWLGTPSVTLNSAISSRQEYIWTDKSGEERMDHADHANADIKEFRVYADAECVYFLIKLADVTDAAKPFVAIGLDTRRSAGSTAMNWLGDDADTFVGDGYFGGGAAVHFPEYQLNIHSVDGHAEIEAYHCEGTSWYGPGVDRAAAISVEHNAIEVKVPRADLNLTGAKTVRFTVASFLNSGIWNNGGGGTVKVADNTSAAVDAISIPPVNTPDNDAKLSAWLEDISDADIDFWVDVKFADAGLVDNSRPTTPVLVAPADDEGVVASPTLEWQPSTDADGEITGYLLEISTNEQFNGVSGRENGVVDLRVNLDATVTNYVFTTSASQYWWRVRARDTAGQLSVATTRFFRVVGKLDTEGPKPTLLYIGTDVAGYLAGDYDDRIAKYGPIQSVLDSEIRDENVRFGFVIRWEDPSGVYATNKMRADGNPPNGAGGFAYNIVDTDGRVSPNWDLIAVNTQNNTTSEFWGVDRPFFATNTLAQGNSDPVMTNYVINAFNVSGYNPDIEYYLTLSAEDSYTEGGSWWQHGTWNSFVANSGDPYYSGWCADGPNTARNVTTNFLIRIQVTDDDIIAPRPSKALGWPNEASLVVSNANKRLERVEGAGQDILYQVTDGALLGQPLSFCFNAYDSFYKGIALGTTPTFSDQGRTLTNTSFIAAYWQTNWVNYSAAKSVVTDTTDGGTMLTWHWDNITTQDVTKLWGPDSLSGPLGVTNLIQLDLYDVDNDRSGDQASARVNFGRVVLVDDDPVDPVIDTESLSVTGTGLAREYVLTNLVTWHFTGSGSARLTAANAVVPDDIVSGNFTNDPTAAISGTDVVTVSAGFAGGATRYWEFTLAPVSTTKTFKATSICFDSRVSSLNGPDRIEVFGTMPGGSEQLWGSVEIDLSDSENPVGINWNSYATALAMPSATTGTVTFRLLAYVADTNHLTGTGTATWSVDNLNVSGYILGEKGGTEVTDHDLAHGTVTFSLKAMDEYSGIDGTLGATGRAPRVDFWHETQGVTPITNALITDGWSLATNTYLTISGQPAPADKKQIVLGASGGPLQYRARFTVTDADVDRDGDWRTVSEVPSSVTVCDDDTSRPARGYLYGGPLGVFVDGTLTKAVGSGNARDYRINDEQLQNATATSITVRVNLYDYSGWTVPELCVSNVTAGILPTNDWLTGIHTVTVDTTNNPDACMEWKISLEQAHTMFNTYESESNLVQIVSVWDKDDDRHNADGHNVDALELANARLGFLTFIDNDVGQPNVQSSWSPAKDEWRVPKVYLGLPGENDCYYSGRPLSTNAAAVLSDLTNRVYDSQLAKVSAAAPLSIELPAFDTGGGGSGRTIKGVQRGTTLTELSSTGGGYDITNSWINIGTVQVQNVSAYRADLSSPLPLTRIAAQFPTSVWAFTSFSYSEVGHWLNAGEVAQDHIMTAMLFDADDNRKLDQMSREVSLGTIQVLDNDTVAPSAPANITVNGVAMSGPLDRYTAPWTNQPEFRIAFAPSVDGEKQGTDLDVTGIGEYRVATDKVNIGPDLGTPIPIPADGALANYGFEHGGLHWTLTGADVTTAQAYEGQRSLAISGAGTAVQLIPIVNTNSYDPQVTLSSAYFMGAGTGTLLVEGLDADGNPILGSSLTSLAAGVQDTWVSAASETKKFNVAVASIRVTLSGAGAWDDIQLKVELLDNEVPIDEVSAIFMATEQGLKTNYLFAVDRDNNRPGDRMASSKPSDSDIPMFGTAYDITPPTAVPDVQAATETVDDPTTQFDVTWNPNKLNFEVGPDDPSDARHPTHANADRDIFSPWRSYKVYYGTFDPMDVPEGDPGQGYGDAYIYRTFITNGVYTNWPSITSTNAIADPSAVGTNYLKLTNMATSSIRIYDLDYDQDYAIIVVGLDRAGNEGPANPNSWATNNTIRFAVTQGVMRARGVIEAAFPGNNNLRPQDKGAAALYWIAAGPTNAQGGYTQVNKQYDLIYIDKPSFQESASWTWDKVGTIQSNWFSDAPGQDLARGNMRFYRASYKDRWRRTNVVSGLPQRPLASEDVYALHNIVISEGVNYVGLHGTPYSNTFASVFGTDTNLWPSGDSPATATRIEYYTASTSALISAQYFFGSDGEWYQSYPSGNSDPISHTEQQVPGFFSRAFSITLPSPLPAKFVTTNAAYADQWTNLPAMVWHPILKVPTNGPVSGQYQHTIHCGVQDRSGVWAEVYNLVALNLPVAVHPRDLNLPTNFCRAAKEKADYIYTWDTTKKLVRDKSAIYCNEFGDWFFRSGGPVPEGYFKPNDVLVIISRNGGLGNTWTWTYSPTNFYTLPTRWMGQ